MSRALVLATTILVACGGPSTPTPPATASGAPPEPPKSAGTTPPPAACTPNDALLFEVATEERIADGQSSDLRVYTNGAWTRSAENGELAPKTTAGCLSQDATKLVTEQLRTAPWTVSKISGAVCDVYSTLVTHYKSATGELFTGQICNPKELDATSKQHLDAILAAIGAPKQTSD